MIRALRNLFGLALREDAGTDELAPSLPAAQAELAAAKEAAVAVEQAYRVSLLKGEADALQVDAERRAVVVRIDRATALVEALTQRLAEAQEREAEVGRVEKYEAARRQADEAREALRVHFPELCADVVTLLGVVAQAEIAVKEANGDLPRGAAPLARVEGAVRDAGGIPRRIISETTVERWCLPGSLDPDRIDQSKVHQGPNGDHYVSLMGRAKTLVRRQFNEIRYTQGVPLDAAEDLALRIRLPGLGAREPAYWEPVAPLHGRADPHEVLARISSRRSAPELPDAENLPVEVKYVPVGFYDLDAERQGNKAA